ncbi:MAG: phosphoribosyltransferase family protein [Bacilli bacterium]|nr:phosphoribosyltransferase family protein [Bacilli bacterium]
MSLAEYKPPLSKLLIQYKENRDVELAPIFLSYYSGFLHWKYFGFSVVLVPSSPQKMKEREFDHLELIFKYLNLPILKILTKKDGQEQKKTSAAQRRLVYQKINITRGDTVTGKKILLVDDVITTGSTLKACLNLLKKYRPKKIEILTLMNASPLKEYEK